jgi:hypothetical protein
VRVTTDVHLIHRLEYVGLYIHSTDMPLWSVRGRLRNAAVFYAKILCQFYFKLKLHIDMSSNCRSISLNWNVRIVAAAQTIPSGGPTEPYAPWVPEVL